MQSLYPLKFQPILKDRIWGGRRLQTVLNKNLEGHEKVGESWEISGVEGNLSVVSNGFLQGNNLEGLIEVYMGDILGDRVFEQYGLEFPLLLKYIDASEILSVQVHPDDALAEKRHGSNGKTEMWYVIDAFPESEIITGFNREMSRESYLEHLNNGKLTEILNTEKASAGDVFYIPAGRVHATGAGILLAEIQQTSDITYRIYDWDRTGENGKGRELHTQLALDALDFRYQPPYKTSYQRAKNKAVSLVQSPYFTSSLLELDQAHLRDFHTIDSFMVFMCLEGTGELQYGSGEETIETGDTLLVPASLEVVNLIPQPFLKVMEVYIP